MSNPKINKIVEIDGSFVVQTVEMSDEEYADYMYDYVDETHNPTSEERIEALEAIIQAQADALERLGVIPDA